MELQKEVFKLVSQLICLYIFGACTGRSFLPIKEGLQKNDQKLISNGFGYVFIGLIGLYLFFELKRLF